MSKFKSATLVLENGKKFEGFAFGDECSVSGEVVFSTAMTGYTESLTDPSYQGQILVMTYPLVGNYGVPDIERVDGVIKAFESENIHIRGLVVTDYSFEYSHWNAAKSLDQWLKDNHIPAIFGVDTRELTKEIRENGVMLGKILPEGCQDVETYYNPNVEDLVSEVSCAETVTYGEGDCKVVVLDCGCKESTIYGLLKRGVQVVRVPYNCDLSAMDYDGVLLSNGPGNAENYQSIVENIRKAMAQDKPIFGMGLGHQLLALAAGAKIFKLKYGHRGASQPVAIVGQERAVMTSQNHGYAVDSDSLPEGWQTTFTNLNDGTNEGISHKTKPFSSVQFTPEATRGPEDVAFLFDNFIEQIRQCKK